MVGEIVDTMIGSSRGLFQVTYQASLSVGHDGGGLCSSKDRKDEDWKGEQSQTGLYLVFQESGAQWPIFLVLCFNRLTS